LENIFHVLYLAAIQLAVRAARVSRADSTMTILL
jgi:hypothetical protein